MLGEFIFDDFSFLVICDMCGHLCYECDTLVVNEIVLCEDCRDFRDTEARFVVWPPAISERQPTSRSRVDKPAERPNDLHVGSSPTPLSERTEGESKGPTRATGTGSLQTSIERSQDALLREPRKEKPEKPAVKLSGGQAVHPLPKQQEHTLSGRTRDKIESRTQSPVAQNPVSRVPRTDSKQKDGKGCLSGTALIVFGTFAFILVLMYISGVHGLRTRDVAAQQTVLDEVAILENGKLILIEVPVGMLDREF